MPTFRFIPAGPFARQLAARRIEAASREEAVALLAAEGIDVATGDLVDESAINADFSVPTASLSAEQSMRVAEGVVGLTAARLPLESGLEALADEFARGGTRRAIYRVAGRLRSGESLATAADGLPPLLRSLLSSSVAGGRFLEVLPEVAAIEARRMTLRSRLRQTLLYPSFLLLAFFLIYLLLSLLVGPNIARTLSDFGTMVPLDTRVAVAIFSPAGALMASVVFGVVLFVGLGLEAARGTLRAAQDCVYAIPLLGPAVRSAHWAEWLRLLGLLVRLRVPLPEALRRIAQSHRSIVVADASHAMARRIEQGVSLATAIEEDSRVPGRLRPLVEQADDPDALDATLLAAAEALEAQSRQRSGLFQTIVLPFLLAALICGVGFFISAFLVPLVSLIQKLS